MNTHALDPILANIYLKFLLTLAAALILAFLVRLIIKKVLRPLAQRTKTRVDDLFIKSLSVVAFYAVLAFGLKIGIGYFSFETQVLVRLVDSLLIVIITVFLIRIIHNFAAYWRTDWALKTESTADDRLIPLVEKILGAVVVILGGVFILDTWEVNITPLLGTAGLAGIALSFAVKDSLANIFGGIQLVIDKTFKVGDKIQLQSGEMGEIQDIGLRSTKLRTYDNEIIYIPNGSLANAMVKNFTVPDLSIRVNVHFGVAYGSDTAQVREVVLAAVQRLDNVLAEPEPVVHFLKMSDFSLDFVVRVWVGSYAEAYSTQVALTDAVYNALNQAGIEIPFPTRTVYTKNVD